MPLGKEKREENGKKVGIILWWKIGPALTFNKRTAAAVERLVVPFKVS